MECFDVHPRHPQPDGGFIWKAQQRIALCYQHYVQEPFCHIELLCYRIKQCQEVMTLEKLPYTSEQIIQNVLHLLMALNIFPAREFDTWEHSLVKTYPSLKSFIHKAYTCHLNSMELRNTAAGLGYTVPTNNMYHVFEGDVNDSNSAMDNTVAMIAAAATTGSTLGTGTAASNIHLSFIETINQSIAPMFNQVVQNQSVLQNQIAAMLLAQSPPAQVAPPVQHVAFPMQQPFQPPMQQQQYQQAVWYGGGQQGQFQGGYGGQGGRGRGRGGSRGGRQHRPSFATMIRNQQGQGQLAPYQGYQGGMFAPPNPFGGTGLFLPAAKAMTSTNAPTLSSILPIGMRHSLVDSMWNMATLWQPALSCIPRRMRQRTWHMGLARSASTRLSSQLCDGEGWRIIQHINLKI